MRIKVIPYNTLEYASRSVFPVSGESNKNYLALDTMLLYAWNTLASEYVPAEFRYEGKPAYHGSYLKSGSLEFQMVASSTPIDWHNGDYIRYSRTNRVYKMYGTPQIERQARTNHSGESFAYRNVMFYDNMKQTELVPFRDYVVGDNQYFFSSKQQVETTEPLSGIVARLNVNLSDFFGEGVWQVKIAENIPSSFEIEMAKDFSVSGTCFDALNTIFETWHNLGWVYSVENNVNTITLGYPNIEPNVSGNRTNTFSYGNGLNALKRNAGSMDDFCTRMHIFGTERNLINRYYNSKDIYNAQSVHIPNLMIPIELWGQTDNKPDASKAYIEDADKIALYGLITKDVYFDGTDGKPEVYPSIEEQTIALLKAAKESLGKTGAGAPDYYPQTDDDTLRVDAIKSVVTMPLDDGSQDNSGEKYVDSYDATIESTIVNGEEKPSRLLSTVELFEYTFDDAGIVDVNWNGSLRFVLDQPLAEGDYLVLRLQAYKDAIGRKPIATIDFDAISDVTNGKILNLNTPLVIGTRESQFTGKIVVALQYSYVTNQNAGVRTITITKEGNVEASVGLRDAMSTIFRVKTQQIGFDISKMTSTGGATLSMKSGLCAGRDFPITKAAYNASDDSWTLTCKRTQDNSIETYFPNAKMQIKPDDLFVILGITMPEEYIIAQAHRLANLGQELFNRVSVFKPSYEPTIDSKKVLENIEDNPGDDQYILLEGKYMSLYDPDIIGGNHLTDILITELTINEDESEIATYRVVLSDKNNVSGGLSRTVANMSSELQSMQAERRAQTRGSSSGGNNNYLLPNAGLDTNPIFIQDNTPQPVTGLDLPGRIHTADNVEADGGMSAKGIGDLPLSPRIFGSATTVMFDPETSYEEGVPYVAESGIIVLPAYPSLTGLATQSWVSQNFAVKGTENRVSAIEALIPSQATVQNQLADKAFVASNYAHSLDISNGYLRLMNNASTPAYLSRIGLNSGDGLVQLSSGKIPLSVIPDVILGQLMFGGYVNASGVATLSTNAKTKLGITADTVQLVNEAGTSSTYGWVRFEGVFFLMSANSSFAGLSLQTGDWLISTGTQWGKIDNTDAVTGVKGDNESTYRIGNVNITKGNIGLGDVENTKLSTWAGTSNITTLGTITAGVWHGTKIAKSYLADAVQTSLGLADTSIQGVKVNGTALTPSSGIVDVSVPTALSQLSADATHRLVTDSQISAWGAKYDKPSGGIPKSDLASAVQSSLASADSAVQIIWVNGSIVPADENHIVKITDMASATTLANHTGNTNNPHGVQLVIGTGSNATKIKTTNGDFITVPYATKAAQLYTSRTLWGQSFDGTQNVSGDMTGVGSITASGNITTESNVMADGGVSAKGISDLSIGAGGGGTATSVSVNGTTYVAQSGVITIPNYPTWGTLSGKPTLATVATSGNYNDLSNKPTFYDLAFYNGSTLVDTYKPTTSPSKSLKAGTNITLSAASNVITIASKVTVTSSSVTDGTTTFNKYVHPTTSGNKHIPSGGSSGQFLGWSADGTATWVNNPNTHYTAVPILGGSSATSNATTATANNATYLNIIENGAKSGGVQITGSGLTSVSAKDGKLTISSAISASDVNTAYGFTLTGTAGTIYALATISSNASNGNTAYGYFSSGILKAENMSAANIKTALGYTPFDNASFTQANIKSTLGISDWALAASKPSYAFSEITGTASESQIPTLAISKISGLQTALDGKLATSLKGAANGLAELDANGLVPSSQLPSYVDDIVDLLNITDTAPSTCVAGDKYFNTTSKKIYTATGTNTWGTNGKTPEGGKIYVNLTDNNTYRWSGSTMVEISPSLALGETSSTAYRGDRGKIAYDHATDASRLTTAKTSGFYKFATTAEGHIASVTAVTASDLTGLLGTTYVTDISWDDTNNKLAWSKGGTAQTAITIGLASKATQLATARKIWGKSFNGTTAVDGNLCLYGSGGNTGITGTTNANSAKILLYGIDQSEAGITGPHIQAINVDSYGKKRFGVFQHNSNDYTTENTEVFSILPNGNVGIGTTSPAAKLQIHGASGEVLRLSAKAGYVAGNGPLISFWHTANEQLASISGVFDMDNNGNYGNLVFGTRSSDSSGVTTKMLIKHNGNVGIGTTSPSQKLQVAGTIYSSVAQGTAPLKVDSTTMVTNLNAEYLGGTKKADLFSAFENSNEQVSATIGGTNKKLTVDYATKALRMKQESLTAQEFTFRNSPKTIDTDSVKFDRIFGRTLVWNQMITTDTSLVSKENCTLTKSGNQYVITPSASATSYMAYVTPTFVPTHYYLYACGGKYSGAGTGYSSVQLYVDGRYAEYGKVTYDSTLRVQYTKFQAPSGTAGSVVNIFRNTTRTGSATDSATIVGYLLIDLTLMFGSGNEPTAEQFKALYPNLIASYNSGQLINNSAKAIESVGFNLWDEEWYHGTFSQSDGETISSSSAHICSVNKIPVIGGQTYYFKFSNSARIFYYDHSGSFLTTVVIERNSSLAIPTYVGYIRFHFGYSVDYANDICVNISDTSKNGTYEPYKRVVTELNLQEIKVKSPNIWDEEWESGGINGSTGEKYPETRSIRSKNYIPILPSTIYCFRHTQDIRISSYYYDENKNFISASYPTAGNVAATFSTPSNAAYLLIRIGAAASPVTEYANDVCINKSDPAFDGRYFPHGVLTFNGLKSAGSVYDEITNGGRTLIRRIGDVDDLSRLNWSFESGRFYTSELPTKAIYGGTSSVASVNTIISTTKYTQGTVYNVYDKVSGRYAVGLGGSSSAASGGSTIMYVIDSNYTDVATFKVANAGVGLNYELANYETYELVEPIPMSLPSGTTERRLPEDTQDSVIAPFVADMTYGTNNGDVLNDVTDNRYLINTLSARATTLEGYFTDGVANNAARLSNTSAIGSTTKPVYFTANGVPAECSTYAGGTAVTLNNSSKAASTASFYAPTAGGTKGYSLIGNGTTSAPVWSSLLFHDTTNSRIGVNTTSPTKTLDVSGTFRATGDATFGGTTATTGVAYHSESLVIDNDKAIYFKEKVSSGTARTLSAVTLNQSNVMSFGYGAASYGMETWLNGDVIKFRTGTSTNNALAATIDADKNLLVLGDVVADGGMSAKGISDLSVAGGSHGEVTSIQFDNNTAYTTATPYTAQSGLVKLPAYPTWANLSGKPTLATVATTGNYNDLSNKPTSKAAVQGGTELSLVYTGDKWNWDRKSRLGVNSTSNRSSYTLRLDLDDPVYVTYPCTNSSYAALALALPSTLVQGVMSYLMIYNNSGTTMTITLPSNGTNAVIVAPDKTVTIKNGFYLEISYIYNGSHVIITWSDTLKAVN